MAGVSAGPRKFPMMKNGAIVESAQFKSGSGWVDYPIGAGSRILVHTQKMDLRAFDGNALDFTNIVIQESAPFIFPPVLAGSIQNTVMLVYDTFSTVPIINNAEEAVNLAGNLNTQGFLPFNEGTAFTVPERNLNPSQVIYGLWRVLSYPRDNNASVPQVFASSEFGSGELVVAPEMYWTRYLTILDWDGTDPNFIPAANAMMSGVVYDISENVELAQMSRAVQR